MIRFFDPINRRRPRLRQQVYPYFTAISAGSLLLIVVSQQLLAEVFGAFSYRSLLIGVIVVAAIAALAQWLQLTVLSDSDIFLERIRRFMGELGKARNPAPPQIAMERDTAGLAQAARRLQERLRRSSAQATQHVAELEAMLQSMREGILLIDRSERLLQTNRASRALLNLPESKSPKLIQEMLRNAPLLRFISEALGTQTPREALLNVDLGAEERHLSLFASPVRLGAEELGTLIVIDDVTELKKLENLRKDFVTNVSHELRTPLTSIQGYLETLSSGAVSNEEDRTRFYEIMLRQSQRLNEIFNDLLTLSQIERQEERGELNFSDERLDDVIAAAVGVSDEAAHKAQVELIAAPCGLSVRGNFGLLQQALVNLIDNAIKYAASGKRVEISASEEVGMTILRVRDFGPGVAEEHRSRIFERFYRVDRGRSRKDGGSGLGLAIVKHIAKVHRGSVAVQSAEPQGSIFEISIPR